MPAGNNSDAQQYEAEDADPALFDDDDDADVIVGGKDSSSSRQRGSASDRLKAVFNQKPLHQAYAAFGIILPADLSPKQR